MKLNKEQYLAARHTNGPMLVLAGPGSGKTHLLVERIRMMIEEVHIPPEKILVITFSKKAARQMQARFHKRVEEKPYPVTFGTFHAVFYHILLEHDPGIYRLITEEEQRKFIALSAVSCALTSDLFAKEENTELLIGMIQAAKNFGDDLYEHNEYAKDMTEEEREGFEKLIKEYDRLCRASKVIDFDDMIIMCNTLLYEHEGILRKWRDKYRYILVDEFQDINDAQYNVLRLLAGDERNVFAVGDDDQSIYAFRGARPRLMKKFLHQYPGCKQVTLTMNYRCCKNVIGAADTLIRNNTERLARPMQRHLPSHPGGEVIVVNAENTVVQAVYVCDMIEYLSAEYGYKPCDFAVLYRSAFNGSVFIKEAEDRGYRIRTADETAISKAEKVRAAYKRAHDGSATRGDYFLIMNNPPRGLSREALCNDTGDRIGDMKAYYAGDEKMLEMVADLERTIQNSTQDPHIMTEHGTEKDDMINVMTAHASKGLEFSVVFIIGLQEGLFPHYKNMTGSAVEEERRLMYVAMTRAKERLYMCSVSTEHGKRPSRFAAEASRDRRYISDIIKITRI